MPRCTIVSWSACEANFNGRIRQRTSRHLKNGVITPPDPAHGGYACVPAEKTPLVKGPFDVAVPCCAPSSGAPVPYAQLALARRGELCRRPLRPLLGACEPSPRGGREPPRPAAPGPA